MEERIKAIYNECWKSYKEYLSNHDMKKYNERSEKLTEKYGYGTDIIDLLLWFAPRINALHDRYMKEE